MYRLAKYIYNEIEWMEVIVISLQVFRQQNDSIMIISILCKLKIYIYFFKTLNDGVILIQY